MFMRVPAKRSFKEKHARHAGHAALRGDQEVFLLLRFCSTACHLNKVFAGFLVDLYRLSLLLHRIKSALGNKL